MIARAGSLSLPIIDLSDRSEEGRETEATRLAEEESRRPFDLSSDLMLRTMLLRLGERDHIVLLTLHHIAADGWSMGILYRELSAFYQAFATGTPLSLPELPIQYTDFAHSQRKWLEGEVLQTQLSYWRLKLQELPILELPTDFSRPAIQTYRGASETTKITWGTVRALRELSRKEGATLFMTLLAAFKLLLSRYTGQDDIVIGTPIAGRNRSEIEGLIGFFINTLVLRTDVSGDCTFRDLLRRVRETALGAYAHQDLPFEKLVEELQPERDLSRNPLFQVFFNMIQAGGDDLRLPDIEVESLASFKSESKFDLTLYVWEQAEGAQLMISYNTDLFEPNTISCMLKHYGNLLQAITADPDRAMSDCSLLTEEDELPDLASQKNVVSPTKPSATFKKEEIEQSIVTRFEEQAALLGDKIAVKSPDEEWTYSELNCRANQIARAILQQRNVGEERVALLFEHGPAMLAAILGVLKSGKAYMPLEPNHPKNRLSDILQDGEPGVIICDQQNLGLARELSSGSCAVIALHEIDPATSAENVALDISPNALAYLLYTSGSTGHPKGVMQNHRNVLHYVRCYTNSLRLDAGDRLTLLSAYSHDAAVIDVFAGLLNGVTLYPWSISERGLIGLFAWIDDQELTIYHSTPTVFRTLIDTLDFKLRFSKVRAVVLGGELASKKDYERFLRHFSSAVLYNLYGSTESSFNSLLAIDSSSAITQNRLSIGYPVEDTEVILLSSDGEVAEIYGEIGVRSEHVALGYWRSPQLTSTRFLPDPAGGSRSLYRTGDMGRLMWDGSIGYLGRRDDQIKIRGYRVELGEIANVLSHHPAVKQALVDLRTDESRVSDMLVGYVVMQTGEVLNPETLRDYLKQRVPEYMLPSLFLELDALPLMRNGKVDRRKLPMPEAQATELNHRFIAPRTPIEQAMVEIWREVLDVEHVGIKDNFFSLGGHSLLVIQVIYRVKERLDADVPLRALFEKPTVEEFAAFIADGFIGTAYVGALDAVLREIEAIPDEAARSLVSARGAGPVEA